MGEWGLASGQTCLGSFSLLSVKVIRSIIHSSICHIAVSLTLKLPGEGRRDRSTSVVQNETAREMKQQDTSLRSLPLVSALSVPLWTFFILHMRLFQRHWWNSFCNLELLPQAPFSPFRLELEFYQEGISVKLQVELQCLNLLNKIQRRKKSLLSRAGLKCFPEAPSLHLDVG